MNARTEPIRAKELREDELDVEGVFRESYSRIARLIGRITNDPARSEELAVEVFYRLWRRPVATGAVNAWLYRTSVRIAIDELRRRSRRRKREERFSTPDPNPTPEQLHAAGERREHVRAVLSAIRKRDAELLILRSEGLSYQETADALGLNTGSIGTLLRRAQLAFRNEYRRRYD